MIGSPKEIAEAMALLKENPAAAKEFVDGWMRSQTAQRLVPEPPVVSATEMFVDQAWQNVEDALVAAMANNVRVKIAAVRGSINVPGRFAPLLKGFEVKVSIEAVEVRP